MIYMKSIEITKQYAGERVDKICFKVLKNAKKSFVFKMFRKKNIVLNDKKIKGDERCQLGDSIQFYLADETFNKFSGIQSSKDEAKIKDTLTKEALLKDHIIYEDTHVLIYSKPKGILSQPNGKNVNVVDQYDQYAKAQGIVYDQLLDRYGVCTRLDRNTSGLLIIGKNALALRRMNESIKNHQVDKRYRALVLGRLNKSIELKGYQKKDKNNQVTMTMDKADDYIHTVIHPIDYHADEDYTLVDVELHTGKTHQIRHHLSSIHHPIIGDLKYGDSQRNTYFLKKYGINNQLLHSYSFTFLNVDDPLAYLIDKTFIAPYPMEFRTLLGKGDLL